VRGLISEGEPLNNGRLVPYYSNYLDELAAIDHRAGAFAVLLAYGRSGASYQASSRRVQEATMLLAFAPGHLVDWADLEQGSTDLSVWPEESIYPTDPIESMREPRGGGCLTGEGGVCAVGGHHDIQVAAGVYRREFAKCAYHGTQFGRCAAIVNTTGQPVTVRRSWLRERYRHEIVFDGGDVQSGGTVALSGAKFTPGRTVIEADDAILLSR
jgi:hypothetical protein